METRKLYYEDPFQKGFATTVVSCDEVKGGYAVVLAETAFYPEGGGQPYDTGVLGEANVLEVHEKNGVITHLCDKPFEVGKSVSGKIDWARRFDHMQQHSGEHICSGLICERFHCDNVGFHMGADVVTIDFDKVDAIRGMDICFVTTAKTDEEAKELLKALGAPFAN